MNCGVALFNTCMHQSPKITPSQAFPIWCNVCLVQDNGCPLSLITWRVKRRYYRQNLRILGFETGKWKDAMCDRSWNADGIISLCTRYSTAHSSIIPPILHVGSSDWFKTVAAEAPILISLKWVLSNPRSQSKSDPASSSKRKTPLNAHILPYHCYGAVKSSS